MFEFVIYDAAVDSIVFSHDYATREDAERFNSHILKAISETEAEQGEIVEVDCWVNDWSDQ